MATAAESRMNLAALQQRDRYITAIVDTASQVALYSFSASTNEWEKTEIEGTLFVYTRSACPINGFMILNRLGLTDQIEPLNKNLEFQLQDPFLLYRNGQADIFGIWFYDKDECARIGQLLNSLVQVAIQTQETKDTRQRRASESDSMEERMPAIGKAKNVDIMQMLSQAQHEYDKSKAGPSTSSASDKQAGPKPMIDNPNASAMKSSTLIKPQPRKVQGAAEEQEGAVGGATTPTQISLDALFQRAGSMHTSSTEPAEPTVSTAVLARSHSMVETKASTGRGPSHVRSEPHAVHDMLAKLMSNSGTTVEEIERQQRGECPRDQMPKPAGAEAPSKSSNHQQAVPVPPAAEPESPNTALRRTLNILTPSKPVLDTSVPVTPQALSMSASGSTLAGMAATKVKQQQGGSGVDLLTNQLAAMNTNPLPGLPLTTNPLMPGIPTSSTCLPGQAVGKSATGDNMEPARSSSGEAASDLNSSSNLLPLSMPSVTPSSQPSTSSVLLTPQAFASASPTPPFFTPAASGLPMPTVLSLTGSGDTSRLSGSISNAEVQHKVTPLTQEQMQQALLYLVQNDPDFLKTLHEAYVKSLNTELSGPRS